MHHQRKKRKFSFSQKPSTKTAQEDFRPREERSYTEYPQYSAISPATQLHVILVPTDSSISKTQYPATLPASSKELSSRIAAFRHTLPTASYQFLYTRTLLSPSTALPTKLNRFLLPTESELTNQIEYDMDEEDFAWLAYLNSTRRQAGCPPITAFIFEIVMDKLEKEWFWLTKHMQKRLHQEEMSCLADDLVCEICGESDTSNSNVIVICDGCDLPVHQECYGVPFVPEGPWLCRRCYVGASGSESKLSCLLCPDWWPSSCNGNESSNSKSAAFKQTVDGNWVHSVCAFWIDEIFPLSDAYQEPIAGIEQIPAARWKLSCAVCGKKDGAAIQCSSRSCKVSYHATCAKRAGYLMDCEKKVTYCLKHSEEQRQQNKRLSEINEREEIDISSVVSAEIPSHTADKPTVIGGKIIMDASSAKENRSVIDLGENSSESSENIDILSEDTIESTSASAVKVKKRIPQIINNFIFERLELYMADYEIRKKREFLAAVARYWSLKRESRKGIPLLKRLHMEFNNMLWSERNEEYERTAKQRYFELLYLKQDVTRLRFLLAALLRREREKLNYMLCQREQYLISSRPLNFYLNQLLFEFRRLDSREIFAFPVSAELVPNYSSVISNPMDFSTMQQKIDEERYGSLEAFRHDFQLVVKNAMTFNKPSTIYYKAAIALKEHGEVIFEKVKETMQKDCGNLKSFFDHFTMYPETVAIERKSVKGQENQQVTNANCDNEVNNSMIAAKDDKVKKQTKISTFFKHIDAAIGEGRKVRIRDRTGNEVVTSVHDTKEHTNSTSTRKSVKESILNSIDEKNESVKEKRANVKDASAETLNLSTKDMYKAFTKGAVPSARNRERIKSNNDSSTSVVSQSDEFSISPTLSSNQIVWAKLAGFPWWPAILVVERKSPLLKEAPKLLFDVFSESKNPPEGLVKFFDSSNSWSYIPFTKLSRVSGDFAADIKRLNQKKVKSMSKLKSFYQLAIDYKL